MNETNYCEAFGSIEKLEQLKQISTNIIPGTLVFRSASPFWGYYDVTPDDYGTPIYLYLVVDKSYAVLDIVRAYQKIQPNIDFELDIAKAFISFHDKKYNAIRVRHLDGYNHVSEIQELLEREGIKQYTTSTKQSEVTASIILRKVFYLEHNETGISLDLSEPNHAYIKLPRQLTFDEFSVLTQKVRNNWLGSKFDAALASFVRSKEVIDMVRIYSENNDEPGYLEEIQKLYLAKV